MAFEEEQGKRRRRNDNNSLGIGTDQFAKLPDELAARILSLSVATLNEAARCSSLGRRWRYLWQLIDRPVLDFDESVGDDTTPELFVNRVDQAIGSVQQSEIRLEGLRIGSKLLNMEEAWWRWIQFGLTERVKQLCLSFYSQPWKKGTPVPLFTPDFLRKQELSRLEVVEFRGLSDIPQGTLDHILSNCPSLQRFSINDCAFHDEDAVITVCCPNNKQLQSLTFQFPESCCRLSRIEILSAPGLHSLEVSGGTKLPTVEFGDDIAQLRELRFCNQGQGGCDEETCYFPWSSAQLDKFAPRLRYLKYDFSTYELDPLFACDSTVVEWVGRAGFEKLVVLDLSIYLIGARWSMVKCTDLLRAAPVLREFSISFVHVSGFTSWNDGGAEQLLAWKHHSLQVLQLHGVHLSDEEEGLHLIDSRKPIMELAACIIMGSPCLNQVLVDTRHLRSGVWHSTSNASREPHQVDADILAARIELESRLHSHTATSQIHFIYR